MNRFRHAGSTGILARGKTHRERGGWAKKKRRLALWMAQELGICAESRMRVEGGQDKDKDDGQYLLSAPASTIDSLLCTRFTRPSRRPALPKIENARSTDFDDSGTAGQAPMCPSEFGPVPSALGDFQTPRRLRCWAARKSHLNFNAGSGARIRSSSTLPLSRLVHTLCLSHLRFLLSHALRLSRL